MKYVFVDMDGVIAEYGYPSGLYDGEFQKGNYVGKKPVVSVIDEIIEKYNNPNYIVMICSASPNAKATLEKNDWLNNNFGVPYENRIFITPEEDKVEVIRYYIEDIMHGNVQEHAIIIDDKGSVLAKAHSLGMECYHPTQLMALKAQRDAEQKAAQAQQEIIEDSQVTDEQQPEEPQVTDEVLENNEIINEDEFIEQNLQPLEGEQITIEDLEKIMNKQDEDDIGEE